ncbi:MAG: DNA/RNA nuclease SfsA [Myxococcota bacterium]
MDRLARRPEPAPARKLSLAVDAPLRARFLRRYKRFFADVETEDGETLTVHCPNPGSMKGFHRPGAAVRCSVHDDPRRKLRHTLEMMRVGRVWVGLHPGLANPVVEAALRGGLPQELSGYREIAREVTPPAGVHDGTRSRLDFGLGDHPSDPRPAYVEVKSVTLAEGSVGRFPDSVTERGKRHLEVLGKLHANGARAALVFLVQRADCDTVAPADDIDPAYGEALRQAAADGVELYALGARVTARGIAVERTLPVVL